MKPKVSVAVAVISALFAVQTMAEVVQPASAEAIQLRTMGSFAFGGTVTERVDGTTFHGDHGYVQYYVAAHSRHLPIVMWHGIGQSGKTYETTPDGREGFQSLLPREDWSVYIVDQPRRGRAGYTDSNRIAKKIPTTANESGVWEAFRNGPWSIGQKAKLFERSQFPQTAAAINQFFRQQTPDTGDEPRTTEYRHYMGETGAALFNSIGDGILITHSNSGQYGWEIAMHSKHVKAIVAFEPGAVAFPENEPPSDFEIAQESVKEQLAPRLVKEEHWQVLTQIPILIVYGDNIETQPNKDSFNAEVWRVSLKRAQQFVERINAKGGDATLLHLPDRGIYGNTHAAFADLNNAEILKIVTDFFHEKNLDSYDKPHLGPDWPSPEKISMPLSSERAKNWH